MGLQLKDDHEKLFKLSTLETDSYVKTYANCVLGVKHLLGYKEIKQDDKKGYAFLVESLKNVSKENPMYETIIWNLENFNFTHADFENKTIVADNFSLTYLKQLHHFIKERTNLTIVSGESYTKAVEERCKNFPKKYRSAVDYFTYAIAVLYQYRKFKDIEAVNVSLQNINKTLQLDPSFIPALLYKSWINIRYSTIRNIPVAIDCLRKVLDITNSQPANGFKFENIFTIENIIERNNDPDKMKNLIANEKLDNLVKKICETEFKNLKYYTCYKFPDEPDEEDVVKLLLEQSKIIEQKLSNDKTVDGKPMDEKSNEQNIDKKPNEKPIAQKADDQMKVKLNEKPEEQKDSKPEEKPIAQKTDEQKDEKPIAQKSDEQIIEKSKDNPLTIKPDEQKETINDKTIKIINSDNYLNIIEPKVKTVKYIEYLSSNNSMNIINEGYICLIYGNNLLLQEDTIAIIKMKTLENINTEIEKYSKNATYDLIISRDIDNDYSELVDNLIPYKTDENIYRIPFNFVRKITNNLGLHIIGRELRQSLAGNRSIIDEKEVPRDELTKKLVEIIRNNNRQQSDEIKQKQKNESDFASKLQSMCANLESIIKTIDPSLVDRATETHQTLTQLSVELNKEKDSEYDIVN